MRTAAAQWYRRDPAQAVDDGTHVGPWIDAPRRTCKVPGLNINQFYELKDAADARWHVAYWAGLGATSLKAFMHITRDELRAALDEATSGLKVTATLLHHVSRGGGPRNRQPPARLRGDGFRREQETRRLSGSRRCAQAIAAIDPAGDAMRLLIRHLIDRKVALAVDAHGARDVHAGRLGTAGARRARSDPPRPVPARGVDRSRRRRSSRRSTRSWRSSTWTFFGQAARCSSAPIHGIGGVIAGYSNQRALELLVEAGLTPLDAIKVATLNGATFLGRGALVGSIAAGKQADLVVIDGDPSTRIDDVRKVTLVFKQGVGYDPEKLIASVRGRVGLF
jgi:enamidase